MYWIILQDLINGENSVAPRVGLGHYDSYWKGLVRKEEPGSPERLAIAKDFLRHWDRMNPPLDYEWRIKSDGEVCYTGRCMDPGRFGEDQADDCLNWCMADAGACAATFEYRKHGSNDEWTVL